MPPPAKTRSAPPPLLPKPAQNPVTTSQTSATAHQDTVRPPQKRPHVAQACESCRKRKIRCDSNRPKCGPCVRGGLTCHIAPTSIPNRDYQSVVELLHDRSQIEAANILHTLREADDLQVAVSSIAEAQLLLQITTVAGTSSTIANETELKRTLTVHQTRRPGKRRLGSPEDDANFMFEKHFMADPRDLYVDNNVTSINVPNSILPLSRWTEASGDDRLMNHVLRMFWTWDHIVEKTLYRPIFEEDVTTMDPLRDSSQEGNFCSRFLVNSLLALGSLYTMDPATFKYPEDPVSRGRRWADEAEAHLANIESGNVSIALLQGLIALFCYEGNLGSGTKAVPYLMRAVDVYKTLNERSITSRRARISDERARLEDQATAWCIWGFYCCEWRGTQALGLRKQARKPNAPKVWREPDFPLSQPDSSCYWWAPYPRSLEVQRSMKVEIREVDAELSEIAEGALDVIYPSEGDFPPWINPNHALEFYRAVINWKMSCPSRIRLEEAVLPPAILLHASAEVLFIAILRPFTHLKQEQFGQFHPHERCYAHASSLASVIWTFRSFACLRFEY